MKDIKSKEAILSGLTENTGNCYYEDENNSVFDGDARIIKNAMDIWAKQEAIEFHKWCMKTGIMKYPTLFTEQLFEKYESQK